MFKNKIKSTFIYCREGDLIKIVRRIIDSLKNNAQFPYPVPALADIEKALLMFVAALSNAGGFDRELVSIKKDKKAILQQLLIELAYYVNHTAKGDKTVLLGSGFDFNAERGRSQKKPPKLQVELGLPGEVTTRISRVTGARAYVHQYTADPLTQQSVWISETSLKNVHTFNGLESASRIWFRIIVIDRQGQSLYWDPVLRIVQ